MNNKPFIDSVWVHPGSTADRQVTSADDRSIIRPRQLKELLAMRRRSENLDVHRT